MNNHLLKNKIEKGFVFLYMMAMTFIITLQNTDSIWGNGQTWVDTSVYKYVAWTMDLGYMPYKDAFDHKGSLVYIFLDWKEVW